MNFTETFNEFASKTTPTDLALYAGVAVVLLVLFKDKLSPVQALIASLVNKVKSVSVSSPSVTASAVVENGDVFFALVSSWKTTRDLAVKAGCSEAVKTIDQAFPYLSPNACSEATKS